MRKKIIFFLVLVIVCLGVAWYWYNKPRAGVENKKTDVALTAAQLYTAYNTDEQGSDKKYLNKVIEVKGSVDDIIINEKDAIIMLGLQAEGNGISCRFSSADDIKSGKLKKGMEVQVKGKCAGFNMDVNLTDCIIIL
ncbi:MAG: hypothetical protein QM802_05850 [Agriterribacter sp.]